MGILTGGSLRFPIAEPSVHASGNLSARWARQAQGSHSQQQRHSTPALAPFRPHSGPSRQHPVAAIAAGLDPRALRNAPLVVDATTLQPSRRSLDTLRPDGPRHHLAEDAALDLSAEAFEPRTRSQSDSGQSWSPGEASPSGQQPQQIPQQQLLQPQQQQLQKLQRAIGSAAGLALPAALVSLLDAGAPAQLPPPGSIDPALLNNRQLDKLVSMLGRSKAVWRRAMLLYEWLKDSGFAADTRLCNTLIRVCADHGQVVSALHVYEWMRSPKKAGGAALQPTVYTFTVAMRAALAAGLLERAMQIWHDAQEARCAPDSRLAVTYIEACSKLHRVDAALAMYQQMRSAPAGSPLAATVHAYTAAMRAATEAGSWHQALDIWDDMVRARVAASGHAYTAAIGACAAGGDWRSAVRLFQEMSGQGIRPDVISCTALITALAAAGEADRAQGVVQWMLSVSIKPNVRTYTALISAQGNGRQWRRAVDTLQRMQGPDWGAVAPNSYTYSALFKSLADHGHGGSWRLAEAVFAQLESQVQSGAFDFDPVYRAIEAIGAAERGGNGAGRSNSRPGRRSVGARGPEGAARARPPASALPGAWTSAAQLNGLHLAVGTQLDVQRRAQPQEQASSSRVAPPSGAYTSSPATPSSSSSSHMPALGAEAPTAAAAGAPLPSSSEFSLFSTPPDSVVQPPTTPARGPTSPALLSTISSMDEALQQRPLRSQDGGSGGEEAMDSSSSSYDLCFVSLTAAMMAGGEPAAAQAAAGGKGLARSSDSGGGGQRAEAAGAVVNEVVCGTLMLVFDRAGRWQEAIQVLQRARALGVPVTTVTQNMAIGAAGKARQLQVAERLFGQVARPDVVTYETMLAAYGMAGQPKDAEAVFSAMRAAGFRARDYAYCGLVLAYAAVRNLPAALKVVDRMRQDGVAPTRHVYNSMLAACEECGQYERALEVFSAMCREGFEPDALTHKLMAAVGRGGVRTIENAQAAAAAMSAAMAAVGSVLIQKGMF